MMAVSGVDGEGAIMQNTVPHPSTDADRPAPGGRWWLADGLPVVIRPIERGDLAMERRFVNGLSPDTRFQRLLSGRKLLPGELERWTNIDPAREMALVAVATVDGEETELGVARYVRDDAGGSDFAIVIGDRWQGQGLGEQLLRHLIAHAAAVGVESMGGITLSVNAGMLALARKLGFSARRDPADATIVNLHRLLRREGSAVAQ